MLAKAKFFTLYISCNFLRFGLQSRRELHFPTRFRMMIIIRLLLSSYFIRANSYAISLARRCVPDYKTGKEKEKRCDLRRERKRGRDRDGGRR